MSTTTTKQLLSDIQDGARRITPEGFVLRRISDGTWVSDDRFRKDVIAQAQFALAYPQQAKIAGMVLRSKHHNVRVLLNNGIRLLLRAYCRENSTARGRVYEVDTSRVRWDIRLSVPTWDANICPTLHDGGHTDGVMDDDEAAWVGDLCAGLGVPGDGDMLREQINRLAAAAIATPAYLKVSA